ncbi:hypothetical protein [Micromonospora craniellae]|uniref:Uncharacterized protein n=1 Tax=Micromonospora craniellae TaxID=2294034 RepID=A0A372FWH9_9ACTN|nr:hypothetical protein [Micromonospora craniellae]QOC90794.1 hypothetical protein ID554_22135 [Micromonospora craniellae]RFS44870.1 hypothetical protein D0Q02_19660 [Micromonospora craniellae]
MNRGAERPPAGLDALADRAAPPIGSPAQAGGVAAPLGLTAPAALAPLRDPVEPSTPDRPDDRESPRAQVARTTGPAVSGRGKGYSAGRSQRAGATRQYAFRRS